MSEHLHTRGLDNLWDDLMAYPNHQIRNAPQRAEGAGPLPIPVPAPENAPQGTDGAFDGQEIADDACGDAYLSEANRYKG